MPEPQACNFIKIESLTQVFSSAFCEHLSKNTFFYRTPSLAASVKACNFTIIRLLQGCVFLLTFEKFSECFFDALQEVLKVHKNTGEKIFTKYLSADGCLQIIETLQKFSLFSKDGAMV